MKLVLMSRENTSFKGRREIALCSEEGERLPHDQITIAEDDTTGDVTVTVRFKVDGKSVQLR